MFYFHFFYIFSYNFLFFKGEFNSVIIVFGIFLIINILITINGTNKLDRIKDLKSMLDV